MAGESPASVVYDDDDVLAFMTIGPVTPGHLLVIPKRHAPYLADLDEGTGARVFVVAMRLAAALRASGLRREPHHRRPHQRTEGGAETAPPARIGGGGEQVTLKLVAQYGDACNFGNGRLEVIRQKLEVLERHCDTIGRDYDTIIKSTEVNVVLLDGAADREAATASARETLGMTSEAFAQAFWVGTSEEVAERLRSVIEAGIDYVILSMPRVAYDHGPIQQFAREVTPHFA